MNFFKKVSNKEKKKFAMAIKPRVFKISSLANAFCMIKHQITYQEKMCLGVFVCGIS